MDAVERLRRLCIDDQVAGADEGPEWSEALDERTVALVRIAALIANNAPAASMRSAVDDAVAAGVALEEIVAVLEGLIGDVGLPRVVAAAPRIAVALGHGEDLVPDSEA
ncbi:carboxymuconolactone decarboxylase family protein [Microbacterium sp. NPDC056234]|uniref:carboxymuconolactone decarboxylase family protein n=1 Tax=Microbacterium sp. NPDC056234 TaxID=3345757 RepID=UPI0035D5AC0D